MLTLHHIRRLNNTAHLMAPCCWAFVGTLAGDMRAGLFLLVLVGSLCADDWQDVRLASPLCTVLLAPQALASSDGVGVEIDVPERSASDLGCGFWIGERSGSWFQLRQGRLDPGRRLLRAELGPAQPWSAEPGGPRWSAWRRQASTRWGIFLWSAGQGGTVRVRWTPEAGRQTASVPSRICDLQLPTAACTGERWQMTLRPEPYPSDPFDPRIFAADLIVTRPDEAEERLPAFHDQPMRLADRGDREAGALAAAERFCIRYRPRIPGVHRLALAWRVGDGGERRVELPDLAVSGQPWDDFIRVDQDDPRFLCRQGAAAFTWPIGLNLQSITDLRARETYGMRATTDRGTASYEAYLARLAGAGGDASEIWLCSWNLGLEWNQDWYGYFGLGRYSEFNAARLDRVLDLAWRHGIRLVLNLNNHGQFLPRSVESEWDANPYNRSQGGPLADSDAVFTDREARRLMEQSRRYLAGRVADHPAVMTWKLWSEVDLTSRGITTIRRGKPGIDELRSWHEEAAATWKRLDAYQHPVSTHFGTTWQTAHPRIIDLPGIDLILLDAYFRPGVYTKAENLAGLMVETSEGLRRFSKPFFATEYGGGHGDRMFKKLEIEHATGAWLALVCGHAAAPMLWWREWVDQQNRWTPYRAIRAFLAHEDLRGPSARSIAVPAASPGGPLWCWAWHRPGRILLYLQDRTWAVEYSDALPHTQASILIGETVAAGQLRLEWWDADTGAITQAREFDHPGGRLELAVPSFARHCAAKLSRR